MDQTLRKNDGISKIDDDFALDQTQGGGKERGKGKKKKKKDQAVAVVEDPAENDPPSQFADGLSRIEKTGANPTSKNNSKVMAPSNNASKANLNPNTSVKASEKDMKSMGDVSLENDLRPDGEPENKDHVDKPPATETKPPADDKNKAAKSSTCVLIQSLAVDFLFFFVFSSLRSKCHQLYIYANLDTLDMA
eukprot:TRINITY_DN634_c0_g2_i1.p1 TRINITY_DN634_c0_g2~~TRINITY_DN634_c0_g2_i1.p1  ORF type:complete len:192 (+),score=33.73 TRINITY_DN634_c0_g2_i1:363-938(+)